MTKNKKGFTIIEVVLVLAIASLIFLMVFIALPALQRSQRNTRRRQDMARIITSITEYQTNNGNKMPWVYNGAGGWSKEDTATLVKSYIIGDNSYSYSNSNGALKDGNCSDQFCDPDGTSYRFIYYADTTYYDQNKPATSDDPSYNHVIFAVETSKCTGNEMSPVAAASGAQQFSILYRLEGGAVYCGDNQ
jgi:prepilin-type N-terminal cleavage/methylation domain-containing protein